MMTPQVAMNIIASAIFRKPTKEDKKEWKFKSKTAKIGYDEDGDWIVILDNGEATIVEMDDHWYREYKFNLSTI